MSKQPERTLTGDDWRRSLERARVRRKGTNERIYNTMKDPNRAPFYACLYHGLCDIARKHGYALAIHGTVSRDLDLIAVPWTAEAVPAEDLRDVLMDHIGAVDYEGLIRRQFPNKPDLVKQIVDNDRNRPDREPHDASGACLKPHGRRAWNLYMDFGATVDLSVMPRVVVPPTWPGDDAIMT